MAVVTDTVRHVELGERVVSLVELFRTASVARRLTERHEEHLRLCASYLCVLVGLGIAYGKYQSTSSGYVDAHGSTRVASARLSVLLL